MKARVEHWLFAQGASPTMLAELTAAVGPLPAAYIELLARGNGGEVGLRCPPLNLCLDPVESVLEYWRSGTYTKSGVLVFGGNGGGSLLAFDLREAGKWPVICFDPIDPDGSTEIVASNFEGLLVEVTEHDA